MNEKNHGLIIEGFVQGSYNRMFDNKIEVRHHPLTGWAQATVSGSESNFAATKENPLHNQPAAVRAEPVEGVRPSHTRPSRRPHAVQ